jgi:hypothetical protein
MTLLLNLFILVSTQVVVGYLYLTRIVVYLLESLVDCDGQWIAHLINEVIRIIMQKVVE